MDETFETRKTFTHINGKIRLFIILFSWLKSQITFWWKIVTKMEHIRVSIIQIFIRIFFLENYSLFEYFLTEYSNNNFLLNKP
jgi:hypothetical protein